MANVTKSVIAAGGGDYTTLAAAEAASDVSTGYYKIEIQDTSNYNEKVDMSGAVGTPTINNYVWVTVSAANRHAGVQGTGHARMVGDQVEYLLRLGNQFDRVEYLEFNNTRSFTGSGVSVAATDTLISRCVFSTSINTNYAISTTASVTLSIDNCSCTNQKYKLWINGGTLTCNLDSISWGISETATINNTGSGGTFHMRNCWWNPVYSGATPTSWLGSSYNARVDTTPMGGADLPTNWVDCVNGVTTVSKTSGSYIVITSATDNTLLDTAAGNLVVAAGLDTSASPADPRQDLTLDIAGNTRPPTSVDIGAFQLSAPPVDVDGTMTAVASLTGDVTAHMAVDGTMAAVASLTGDVTAHMAVDGTMAAVASLTGDVTAFLPIDVDGTMAAVASLTGDVTAHMAVDGTMAAVASLTGDILRTRAAVGTMAAVASLTGDVTAFEPPPTWVKIGSPPQMTGGNVTPHRRRTGVSR